MPAVHFETVQTCSAAFLDFPSLGRMIALFLHTQRITALNRALAVFSRSGLRMSALPAVSRFPAAFTKTPPHGSADVRICAFEPPIARNASSRLHSFGSPYTAIYLYAAILASATNTATGVGNGER